MELVYALSAFVLGAGVTAGVALLAEHWDPVARRLRGPQGAGAEAAAAVSVLRWEDEAKGPPPQWRRTVEKLGRILLGRTPASQQTRLSAARARLVWAGYENPRSVPLFLGLKVAMGFGFAYSYTLYGLAIKRVLPQVLLGSI